MNVRLALRMTRSYLLLGAVLALGPLAAWSQDPHLSIAPDPTRDGEVYFSRSFDLDRNGEVEEVGLIARMTPSSHGRGYEGHLQVVDAAGLQVWRSTQPVHWGRGPNGNLLNYVGDLDADGRVEVVVSELDQMGGPPHLDMWKSQGTSFRKVVDRKLLLESPRGSGHYLWKAEAKPRMGRGWFVGRWVDGFRDPRGGAIVADLTVAGSDFQSASGQALLVPYPGGYAISRWVDPPRRSAP